MSVLVDSSVWIAYFRDSVSRGDLDSLIEEDQVVINDLILAELLPALHLRRQRTLISLLRDILRPPLAIDWDEIVQMQIICLRNGVNKVGIPDLIITQHAVQNGLELFSHDRHFVKLRDHLPLSLYERPA